MALEAMRHSTSALLLAATVSATWHCVYVSASAVDQSGCWRADSQSWESCQLSVIDDGGAGAVGLLQHAALAQRNRNGAFFQTPSAATADQNHTDTDTEGHANRDIDTDIDTDTEAATDRHRDGDTDRDRDRDRDGDRDTNATLPMSANVLRTRTRSGAATGIQPAATARANATSASARSADASVKDKPHTLETAKKKTSNLTLLQSKAQSAATAAQQHVLRVGTVGAAGAVSDGKGAIDAGDWGLIAMVLIISFALYSVIFGVQLVGKHQDNDDSEEETFADRWAHRVPFRWAVPKPGVRSEALPAISSKLLGSSSDMPLVVPVQSLGHYFRSGWSVEVLGGAGQKSILRATLMPASKGKRRTVKICTHGSDGEFTTVIASVDSHLMISNSQGRPFGTLVKHGEEFRLEETSLRDPRWAVVPNYADDPSGATMTFTWKPKGRLLATATKGKQFVRIEATPGVDAVLVLACVLGLIIFEFTRGSLPSKLHDVQEKIQVTTEHLVEQLEDEVQAVRERLEGGAADLLGHLPHRPRSET